MPKLTEQDYERLTSYCENIIEIMRQNKHFDLSSIKDLLLKIKMRMHLKPSQVKQLEELHKAVKGNIKK